MTLPTTMTLEEVAAATGGRVVQGAAVRAGGVTIDSRRVESGQLFVAIAGPRFDGHDFVAEAAARGAAAALVHRDVEAPAGLGVVRVADTTRGLADLARHARAQAEVPVVCITGSAGKTTTKDMTAALLATRGPVLKTEGNSTTSTACPRCPAPASGAHRCGARSWDVGGGRAARARHRPDVAVITLVAPVHLEFRLVDAMPRPRGRILEGLAEGGGGPQRRRRARQRIGEAHRARGGRVWFGATAPTTCRRRLGGPGRHALHAARRAMA
jgi:UDP-N-acetylmuramoyl-tripeptide--D-alanyl-D-alanine ligase